MGIKNYLSLLSREEKNVKIKYNSILSVFALSTLFSFVAANNTFATATISTSTSSSTVSLELSPGASTSSSTTNSHTLTVSTSCSNGYRVYASMSSDSADNKLHLNGQNSNNSVTNSISPASGTISTMSSLNDNQWGIRAGSGTTFGNVPTYSTISTKDQTSNPSPLIVSNSAATNQANTITYGAKVNAGVLPGSYSGNVLYTTIMDTSCYTNNIAVNKGTGVDSVSGEGEWSVGATATIGYTMKPGYHFTSWSSSPTTSLNENNTAGSGNTVGTGSATFTVPSTGVTFTANGAVNTYTIAYELNGGTKTGSRDTSGSYTGSISIGGASKNGQKFKGWAVTNDSSASTYNPDIVLSMDMLTGDSNTVNSNGATITLYAIYEPIFGGITTMQEMTDSICFNAEEGDRTTLTDTRDGTDYSIIKLADGNCWMQNDLEIYDTTLTPADSNVSSNFTLPESTDDWGYEYDNDEGIDSGDRPEVARLNNDHSSTLYNYYAASAGTSWWTDDNGSNYDLEEDICPKGWHIPTGGSKGQWSNLHISYGGDGDYSREEDDEDRSEIYLGLMGSTGLYLNKPGYYYHSEVWFERYIGEYWSSTVGYPDEAYVMEIDARNMASFDPGLEDFDKYMGAAIRCVAKSNENRTIQDIETMQRVTSAIVVNTPVNMVAQLRDNRDEKVYTVKKLLDGNLWMTEDLTYTNRYVNANSVNSNVLDGTSFEMPYSTSGWGSWQDGSSPKIHKEGDKVYYNYAAATAGGSYYGDGYADEDRHIEQDICPKGWQIPTGGEGGQFQVLAEKYPGDYGLTGSSGPNFDMSGRYVSGEIQNGNTGYYWTSTINGSTNAYRFDVSDNDSYSDFNLEKYFGLTVRCVAKRDSLSGISTMQQMTPEIVEGTIVGEGNSLVDERDGISYHVEKLADDKIWMMENLDLAGKTISSVNSNLPSGISFWVPNHSDDWGDNQNGPNVYQTEFGALYNYRSITAGTNIYGSNTAPTGDICPKGWRLPTGGSDSGDWSRLFIAFGGNGRYGAYEDGEDEYSEEDLAVLAFTEKLKLGARFGYYDTRYEINTDEGSNWWTSTIKNENNAYTLNIDNAGSYEVRINVEHDKRIGYFARCLAK